jgi:hypothetical protein
VEVPVELGLGGEGGKVLGEEERGDGVGEGLEEGEDEGGEEDQGEVWEQVGDLQGRAQVLDGRVGEESRDGHGERRSDSNERNRGEIASTPSWATSSHASSLVRVGDGTTTTWSRYPQLALLDFLVLPPPQLAIDRNHLVPGPGCSLDESTITPWSVIAPRYREEERRRDEPFSECEDHRSEPEEVQRVLTTTSSSVSYFEMRSESEGRRTYEHEIDASVDESQIPNLGPSLGSKQEGDDHVTLVRAPDEPSSNVRRSVPTVPSSVSRK